MRKLATLITVLLLSTIASPDTIYHDKDNGFSVTLPNSWRAQRKHEKLVKADLTSKDGSTGMNVRVYSKGKARSMTSFIQAHLTHFQSEMTRGGRTLFPIAESKKPVLCATYQMESRGRPTHLLKSYFWDMGDKVLWFQCGTPWKSRKTGETTMDRIAASVVIH